MTNIIKVEGIGEVYSQQLLAAGIGTTEALLAKGGTPQGRKEIAEKTGIGESLILRWVNHVDLFRVKGVAGQYSELLEAAGVDTVVELAQRDANNLFKALVATNQEQKRVRKLPALKQVKAWIKQAKRLHRAVEY